MVYQVPLTYTVVRDFTAHGVSYSKDDVLTTAQARSLRLGLLISARKLRPNIDPYARRAYDDLSGNQPTYITPQSYPRTAGTIAVTYPAPPGTASFNASWDDTTDTRWEFGDGHATHGDDTVTHLYAANGTYVVKATTSGLKATVNAVVTTILITGVTAGSPGSFQPTGSTAPANLTALQGNAVVGNSGSNKPTVAWSTGQYVVLGDASHANWNGTAWASGDHALLMAEPATTKESVDKPEAAPTPAATTNRPPQKKKTTATPKTDNVKPGQEGPAS